MTNAQFRFLVVSRVNIFLNDITLLKVILKYVCVCTASAVAGNNISGWNSTDD